MASNIDPTKPTPQEATTASVRQNFQSAKDEIEVLQDKTQNLDQDGNLPVANVTGDDVSGSAWVLDEDDMASDSATQVPTQQSVKAYVDSSVLTYATGTWTPDITFETPGDLSVAYSIQNGVYVRIGALVIASYSMLTSSFTHTTASGSLHITGLPFAAADVTDQYFTAELRWAGITIANRMDISVLLEPALDYLTAHASGSGVSSARIGASDMPTGGTVLLQGTISYMIDE